MWKEIKIELTIQLTCDILGHKLEVIEREILKGRRLIEVGMILHFYTCVEEGIQYQ